VEIEEKIGDKKSLIRNVLMSQLWRSKIKGEQIISLQQNKYYEIIYYKYILEKENEEIAKILGFSVGGSIANCCSTILKTLGDGSTARGKGKLSQIVKEFNVAEKQGRVTPPNICNGNHGGNAKEIKVPIDKSDENSINEDELKYVDSSCNAGINNIINIDNTNNKIIDLPYEIWKKARGNERNVRTRIGELKQELGHLEEARELLESAHSEPEKVVELLNDTKYYEQFYEDAEQ